MRLHSQSNLTTINFLFDYPRGARLFLFRKAEPFLRRSLGILSLGVIFGSVAGLKSGIGAINANRYLHLRMLRIAGLTIVHWWNQHILLALEAAGLSILATLVIIVVWWLLFSGGLDVKDKRRLNANWIGAVILFAGIFLIYKNSGSLFAFRLNPPLLKIAILGAFSFLLGWIYLKTEIIEKILKASRTWKLASGCLVAFALLNLGFYWDGLAHRPQKPNVVWIVIDTLRADHLSCYGYSRDTSPNIDRLAAKSILFKNTFSQEAYTKASASSYMTSVYPFVHNALYTFPKFETIDPSFTTIAEILKNENYWTAGFTYNPFTSGLENGFQVFKSRRPFSGRGRLDTYETASLIANDAEEFLSQHRKPPFFLYLHYMDVHAPYAPPKPFDTKYLPADLRQNVFYYMRRSTEFGKGEEEAFKSLYDGDISYTDDAIGKMFVLLQQHHLDLKNTILIFSADHGEEFYEEHPQDSGGNSHYRTLYGEQIHVPLMISAPGFSARVVDKNVRLLDVVPTILDLLGIDGKKYGQFEGRSLKPLMQGRTDVPELPVISGGNRGRISIIMGGWKYYKYETKCKQDRFFCPIKPWPDVHDMTFGEQLFHLSEDPLEKTDVLQAQPDIANKMRMLALETLKNSSSVSSSSDIDATTLEQLRSLGYVNK